MSTTGKGFRYPQYTDTPDVPRDLGWLAADVDAYLDAHPGPTGPAGPVNHLDVIATNTIAAGQNASVDISGTSPTQHLTFNIPRGVDGVIGGPGPANVLKIGTVQVGNAGTIPVVTITGTVPEQTLNFVIPKGDTGSAGPTGPTGPKGDAAATIAVATTSTGNPGTQATVTNSGTSNAVVLNFTIPKGVDGVAGSIGPQGPAGPAGIDGSTPSLDPISAKISLASPNTSSTGVNSDWYPSAIGSVSSYYLGKNSTDGGSAKYWKGAYLNSSTVVTSDRRLKENIESTDLGLSFIEDLNPVKYQIVGNESGRWHYGLIAQDVKSSIDKASVIDFGGWVLDDIKNPDSSQALRYEEFIAPLIKAVQELSARVKALEEK
jgi:hypothetical protein